MPGDVNDIVDAAHHEQVAIGVEVPAVAGQVVARVLAQIGRFEPGVVAPQRRQGAGGQRQPDADRALFSGLAPGAVDVQDLHVVAGHRYRRRARLQRKLLHPNRIGGDRPAGLGLPPVVNHRDAQLVGSPQIGVGIQALAGLEQIAQRRQIVAADVQTVGVLLADGANRGGRAEQHLDAVLGSHPPERTRIGGADRLAFIEHGGGTGQQRSVHDVGVADHPPDVGGRPEHIAGGDVVDVAHRPQQRHRMAAVVADDALGLPGGAGGVEDIERIGRRHRHRIRRRCPDHEVVPVHVAPCHQVAAVPVALDDHARIGLMLGQLQRVIEHRFVLDDAGRFDAARRGDDHRGSRIVDPGGQLVGRESAEHH